MLLHFRRPQSSYVRSFRPKVKRPPRPKSSATILGRDDSSSCSSSSKGDDSRKNDFDHISPNVIEKLADGEDKDFRASQPGPFDIVREVEKPKAPESEDEHSGDEDDDCNESDGRGSDDGGDEVKRQSPRKHTDDDDVFDDELEYRIREPPDFDLSPDDLNIEDSRFSFNSTNMHRKRQDSLQEPLSHPFCHMDLLGLSEFKNWKKELKKVPEGLEEQVMDR